MNIRPSNYRRWLRHWNSPTDCTTVREKAITDLIKHDKVICSFDIKEIIKQIGTRIGLAVEEKLQGSRFVAVPLDNLIVMQINKQTLNIE